MCYHERLYVKELQNECRVHYPFAHYNPLSLKLMKKSGKYIIWVLISQYLIYVNFFD